MSDYQAKEHQEFGAFTFPSMAASAGSASTVPDTNYHQDKNGFLHTNGTTYPINGFWWNQHTEETRLRLEMLESKCALYEQRIKTLENHTYYLHRRVKALEYPARRKRHGTYKQS